jgi:hypothetical protein
MHSAGGAQSLGDGDVPLRPRAPRVSGCESSPERCAVTTPELPVNPAKGDRLVERLVVGERCWVRSALLGKDEPHSLRLGPVAMQPGPPFGSISDQQFWKVHGVTVSPWCRSARPPGVGGHVDKRAAQASAAGRTRAPSSQKSISLRGMPAPPRGPTRPAAYPPGARCLRPGCVSSPPGTIHRRSPG